MPVEELIVNKAPGIFVGSFLDFFEQSSIV
jgi:hypothetical protein